MHLDHATSSSPAKHRQALSASTPWAGGRSLASCATACHRSMAPALWRVVACLVLVTACGAGDEDGTAGATPGAAGSRAAGATRDADRTPAQSRLVDALRPAMDLVADNQFDEAYQLAEAYGSLPDALAYQAEFMLGFARHKAMRYAAARAHFERAIELAPDYHPTWHFLGFACHALGDLDRAEEAFREHARLRPGEGDDTFGLAIVALDRAQLDKAEQLLRQALAQHRGVAETGVDRRREFAKIHARLSEIYSQRDDWEEARTQLQQAVEYFTGHDEIWHMLYQAHLRLGEDDYAEQAKAMRDQVRAQSGGGR